MGFLDLFIERDVTPVSSIPANPVAPRTPVVPPIIPQYSRFDTGQSSSSISAEDMAKFEQHFDELFEKANLPGPDYFEFSKMCIAMNALNDDVKFATAFSGLQVQGLTKEKLLESAKFYIKIIDEDSVKFNSAIDTKLLTEAKTKRQLATDKINQIQQKVEDIKKLQKEIDDNQNEANLLTKEANEVEEKATSKITGYKVACEHKRNIIKDNIDKISSYIK